MGKLRTLKDYKCKGCDKLFRPSNSLSKFCSPKCCYENKPKRGKVYTCKICSKDFYRTPGIIGKFANSYCSRPCAFKGMEKEKKQLKCNQCKEIYSTPFSYYKIRSSKYCSKSCMNIARKTKALKTKKKTSLATDKKIVWQYFSKYIRQRDGGVCISCGKIDDWRKMDAGHYIPKTAGLSIYFDERNVNSQCTSCNRWKHGNLSQYALALKIKYGNSILEELDETRRSPKVFTKIDYEKLLVKYKTLIFEQGFSFGNNKTYKQLNSRGLEQSKPKSNSLLG